MTIGKTGQSNDCPRRIREVAIELGIDPDILLPHGHYIAKIPLEELRPSPKKKPGALILVTAMSPTPQGEGKTTTTIGLGDGLRTLGKKAAICLREPSLGPYFGMKGGGTGARLDRGIGQLFEFGGGILPAFRKIRVQLNFHQLIVV